MGLQPNIQKKRAFLLKTCSKCGQSYGPEGFIPVKSVFYPDGVVPMCNNCIEDYFEKENWNWKAVNKLCQMIDVPFVPTEWEKIQEMNDTAAFQKYAEIFLEGEYDDLGWEDYYEEFKQLKQEGLIESELPGIKEKRLQEQQERWGYNYAEEELTYLDNLYNGLLTTQNVNGALQTDQAIKICKISLEIDKKIREGSEFDKLLASYDKLVKTAEFTPKNVKNLNDFDTCGELIKWLEKNGWKNKFYDGVTRDVVDETIKNFQNFNQRLYINESGIGDDISNRIQQLKEAKEMETYYDTNKDYDLDEYDNDGYAQLMGKEDDEFVIDVGDDENYG